MIDVLLYHGRQTKYALPKGHHMTTCKVERYDAQVDLLGESFE